MGTDVHLAPEHQGLYAWYPCFFEDVKPVQSAERFTELLGQFGDTMGVAPSLSVEVTARNFGTTWRADDIPADPFDVTGSQKVSSVNTSEGSRRELLRVLARSSQALLAPLYVGEAQNLKSRLVGHMAQLGAHERRRATTHEGAVGDLFAWRAYLKGLRAETLRVCWIDLSDIAHPDVREAVEFLANRWSRPPLGRK